MTLLLFLVTLSQLVMLNILLKNFATILYSDIVPQLCVTALLESIDF